MARYVDADEIFDWIAMMLYLNELDGRTAHKIGSAVEGFIKKHERVELIEDTTIVKDPYGRPGFTCSVCGEYFEGDAAPDFIYCPSCGRMVQDEAVEKKEETDDKKRSN